MSLEKIKDGCFLIFASAKIEGISKKQARVHPA
jgi:hypothetical protein